MLDPLGGLRITLVTPDKLPRKGNKTGVLLREDLFLFTANPLVVKPPTRGASAGQPYVPSN